MHNLSGFILPTDRYEHIYLKGAYSIPPVIAIYNDTIYRYATRTEVHQEEGKHKARQNYHSLFETSYTACKNFIMKLVDKTWYKEIEDPDTFHMNITSPKLLDHITKFCLGLHTFNAVDIPQLMKTLFTNADRIPQFINAMEAAQRKYKQAKLIIQDEYMHAVALKLLLQSGEYETETR